MRRAGWFLVAGVAGLVLASQAVAGTYDVLTCDAAPDGANHAWQAEGTESPYLGVGESCPTNGTEESGLYVRDHIGAGLAPNDTSASWAFTAPADSTITRWRYARWLGKDGDPDWIVYARLGDAVVLDDCEIGDGLPYCESGGRFGSGLWNDVGGIAVRSLHFGVRCAGGAFPCATGGLTIHNAWAYLYSSVVTLTEEVLPDLDPPHGSLLDAGWRQGTHTVEISGSDDLGIRETRVHVDGKVVAQATRDCDFTYTLPCVDPPCSPAVVGGTCGDGAATAVHTIDTTKLADGRHEVQVAAIDAAGNETLSAPLEVRVDNTPPSFAMDAPAGVTTDPKLTVRWASNDGWGSGVSAHELEVSVDGGPWQPWLPTHTTAGTIHTAIHQATPGHTYRFRGRATDATGLTSDWVTTREVRVEPAPKPCDCSTEPGVVSPPPGPDTDDRGETERPAPTSRRRTPTLRVRSIRRRGSRLIVSGTISRRATGKVLLTYTARARGRTYRVRRSAAIRRGRFQATLSLRRVPAHARGRVTIRYAGNAAYRPRTVYARLSR